MAKRGTVKYDSIQHEEFVAKLYEGKRSPSSGAAVSDGGDVRSQEDLFECKQTGNADKPAKSISIKLNVLEKIADEAWSEGREPAIALRIYNPDSDLADDDGNIDLVARLIWDDLNNIQLKRAISDQA